MIFLQFEHQVKVEFLLQVALNLSSFRLLYHVWSRLL